MILENRDLRDQAFDRPCYDYYKDEYGMLAIDDEKAEVVRKIFDRYLEGESAAVSKSVRKTDITKAQKKRIAGASIQ